MKIKSFLIVFGAALIFCAFASISVSAQKVKLRSNINPDCGVNSSSKFADIWADGNIAVMGSYNCRGVFIFDVSNPDKPVLSSWYDPAPRQAFLEAIVIGNLGYFGSGGTSPGSPSGGDGVHIVDLTNPAQPVLLSKVNASNAGGFSGIHEMVVFDQNGKRFLIANYNSFANKLLKVIDVTDPSNPVFLRDINPTEISWVHAMHIRGNRMYTSGWGTGSARGRTEIYDISNLATQAPVLLGFIQDSNSNPTAGNSMHSSWTSEDGQHLYSAREVTNSNGSFPGDVRVYDVSNPAAPLLVNRVTMADLGLNAVTPHNPVVMGDKLYVSWYQAGVQVFDILKPDELARVGQYDTYEQTFLGRDPKLASLADEPWDIICGRDDLQNALPTTYNGTWAVFPFLGTDRVLIGEMGKGLFIVDATGVDSPPKNNVADFDGDGKTDVSTYRPDDGNWYVQRSSDGGIEVTFWGVSIDKAIAGDYDGDGKTDHAVYRASEGNWYIYKSSGGIDYHWWGVPGDIPVPADYDADGRTDIAVYRPSNGVWYIQQSTLGFKFIAWGVSIDKPMPGDYDGDGKADLAVYRETDGAWYVYPSSSGIPMYITWGAMGDIPVTADFTGDDRADFGVYRPSNGHWYIFNGATLEYSAYYWGVAGDVPVPADYDRDGKADIAVFRPHEGMWYRINSSDGAFVAANLGQQGDVPAPLSSRAY